MTSNADGRVAEGEFWRVPPTSSCSGQEVTLHIAATHTSLARTICVAPPNYRGQNTVLRVPIRGRGWGLEMSSSQL